MAKVFQPKIIVHQSGLDALHAPASPYSAFTSPTKARAFVNTRTTYSPLCRTGSTFSSSFSNPTMTLNTSNSIINELYFQAFKSNYPGLVNQCNSFGGERKSTAKRFVCNYQGCGKMFGRNEEKTRHEKIHSGVKPYSCDLCNKRFGRKDHLTQHMRTHNRGRCRDEKSTGRSESDKKRERI